MHLDKDIYPYFHLFKIGMPCHTSILSRGPPIDILGVWMNVFQLKNLNTVIIHAKIYCSASMKYQNPWGKK